jgi:hypothetical protein
MDSRNILQVLLCYNHVTVYLHLSCSQPVLRSATSIASKVNDNTKLNSGNDERMCYWVSVKCIHGLRSERLLIICYLSSAALDHTTRYTYPQTILSSQMPYIKIHVGPLTHLRISAQPRSNAIRGYEIRLHLYFEIRLFLST